MVNDDFAKIENAQEALKASPNQQHLRTIDERIINNYYEEEYMSLEYIESLRQVALKSGLRSCRFRSLCWRIFVDCLPENPKNRIECIKGLRAKYEEIKKKYHRDPRTIKENCEATNVDNPLSQDETSHWNQYFSDDELQTRIKQDVVRAFPDINFFQSEKIQCMMIDILFNYARENANIEYKQGMHEILAPIIFIIHSDHQSYLSAQENGLVENEIKQLLDSKYLEHDSYFLFSNIMERIESWYDNSSIKTTKKHEYVNMEPFSNDIDFNCYSKIGVKLKMITEQLLKRYDEKLYNHLKDLKIAPQIYGIRWMRLLFIREFQMQDLLALWDAIFANGFALCDYIFTAMLVVIRNILLPCDYAECLNHLMRYPSVCDVHYVIHLALHIRDPVNYPEPVEHSTLVLPNPKAVKVQMANQLSSQVDKQSSLRSKTSRTNDLLLFGNDSKDKTKISEMKNVSFEWIEDQLIKFQGYDHDRSQNSDCCDCSQQLEKLNYKTDFCARYMSKHLDILQNFVNEFEKNKENNNCDKDDINSVFISIAELKKIRDILRGTIFFENFINII